MTRKNTDAEATYRPDRRRMLKLFGALGVSGIAGCGGDGDGSTPTRTDVPTGRSTPTEKKTDTPTPTEEPTPTETPTRTGTPEPGASEVVDEPPENFEEFKSTVAAISDPGNFPSSAKSPYAAFEESLSDVDPTPEWFRDAKFGIDFHWGVYSVPAFGSEWYPHNIYKKNHYMKSYHVDTYGPPDEYTYHDLVSKFTAENFDADRWLDLFETAGARFVGPVAEHHDGWSNWDSNINPYNAAAMGPERDLTGELAEATRERDLRFMTSFHHARNGAPFDEEDFERTDPTGAQSGTHYEYAYDNYPSVTEGWPNRAMYANMHTDVFVDSFVAKVIEVVDNYRPDLIWFDNAVESIPDADIYTMLAYCYNLAESEDRDVVVTRKQQDLPISMSVEDYEKGRPASLQDQAWLTDTTLSTGSWSYVEGQSYKSTGQVVRTLIDIVSKNGNMLLNVSPKADGTIPEDQRSRLEGENVRERVSDVLTVFHR